MAINDPKLEIGLASVPTAFDVIRIGVNNENGGYVEIAQQAVVGTAGANQFDISSGDTTIIAQELATSIENDYNLADATASGNTVTLVGGRYFFGLFEYDVFFFKVQEPLSWYTPTYYHTYLPKLKCEFKDEYGNNKEWVVFDRESVPELIEVKPTSSPFVIEYPEKSITDTIRGSGATMDFYFQGYSESVMREMFTQDPRRYKVYLYNVDNDGVYSVDWSGYLNPELYEEDYGYDSSTVGTRYTLTANDGLSILDRFKLTDSDPDVLNLDYVIDRAISLIGYKDGDPYTFRKKPVYLTYPDYWSNDDIIYKKSSIVLQDNESTGTSAFSDIYFNKSNFQDEEFDYLDMKQVLGECLSTYCLSIQKVESKVYVLSSDIKAYDGTIYALGESLITGQELTGAPLDNSSKLINDNDYYSTGQSLTYIPKSNKQTITVDTYMEKNIFPNRLIDSDKFEGNVSISGYVDPDYGYTITEYSEHAEFELTEYTDDSTPYAKCAIIEPLETHESESNNAENCIVIDNLNNDQLWLSNTIGDENGFGFSYPSDVIIKSKNSTPKQIFSGQSSINVNIEAMLQKDINFWKKENRSTYESSGEHEDEGFVLYIYIKIGDRYLAPSIAQGHYYSSVYISKLQPFIIIRDGFIDKTDYPVLDRDDPGGPGDGTWDKEVPYTWSTSPVAIPVVFTPSSSRAWDDFNSSSFSKNNDKWINCINYTQFGFTSKDIPNSSAGSGLSFELPSYSGLNFDDAESIEVGLIDRISGVNVTVNKNWGYLSVGTGKPIRKNEGVNNFFIDPASLTINRCLIKKFDIKVDDFTESNTEFIRTIDEGWTNENKEYTMVQGTSGMYNYGLRKGNPVIERGALFTREDDNDLYYPIDSYNQELRLRNSGYYILRLFREGDPVEVKNGLLEDLVMDMLMANSDAAPKISLTLKSNKASMTGLIRMPDLPDNMFFSGGTYDVAKGNINGTWVGIKQV